MTPAPDPTLRALLEEGLWLLALLKAGARPLAAESCQAGMEALVAGFGRRARELGKPPAAVDAATYAFCALADEILLGAGSPLREDWQRAPLQLRVFGEHLAGEGFYQRLEQLRRDPAAHREALEVFRACLLLGFQGRYALEDPARPAALAAQLGHELARIAGPEPALAPAALPPLQAPARTPRLRPGRTLAVAAAAALLLFVGCRLLLRARTADLARAAARVLPGL